MTRDDIIRMAREADVWVVGQEPYQTQLERFATLVAAAERERLSAKFMEMHNAQQHSNNYWHFAARKISEET